MNAEEQNLDLQDVRAREQPFQHLDSKSPDWRVLLGAGVTFFWLGLLSLYVSNTIGWANISRAPIETLGNFLEGAFAPLAFLWLVIGYFLQKKELTQNTDAIKMQYIEIQKSAAQAEIQSEAIRASEMHARKESFLRIAESVQAQLGSIMAFLFLSSQGAPQGGRVSQETIADMWKDLGQNDPEVFSRSMLQMQFAHNERYAYKLLYGTPVRTRHTESFIFNFERLLNAASACDDDGMISDALRASAHGRIYEHMVRRRDNPPAGFSYGVYDFDPDTIED